MTTQTDEPQVTWRASRRRREAQFDDKRDAILKAAAVLFRERGYEAASLNELADLLKVTKPTIYYYFENKDKLLLEVKRRAQQELLSFIEEEIAHDTSGYEKLRAIMLRWGQMMISDYGACLTLIPARALEQSSRELIDTGIETAARLLYRVFEEGKADGSLRIDDPVVASNALFGSLNWIAAWYNPEGRLAPENLVTMQVDLLLNGVAGDRPEPKRKRKTATADR